MSDTTKQPSEAMIAPEPVIIAGLAIIAIRCLNVLMLVHVLGWQEVMNFLHRSAQAWDSTLIFIASQLIFFTELRCALILMRGANRGRWGYLLLQLMVVSYMLVASLGGIYPEIFSIEGGSNAEIIHRTLAQKLPDLAILLLLFLPASSRAFFRRK